MVYVIVDLQTTNKIYDEDRDVAEWYLQVPTINRTPFKSRRWAWTPSPHNATRFSEDEAVAVYLELEGSDEELLGELRIVEAGQLG